MTSVLELLEQPKGLHLLLGAFLVALSIYSAISKRLAQAPYPGIPLVGSENGYQDAKARYISSPRRVLQEAVQKAQGVFQVITDSGPRIIIPLRFVDEIKGDAQLSFAEFVKNDLMGSYSAFGGFIIAMKNDIFQDALRVKLTQALTRAFLGERLSRDATWLRISAENTMDLWAGAYVLRQFPKYLRPIMYRILPQIKKLKASEKIARGIIESEIQRRKAQREKELEAGIEPEEHLDALQWLEDAAKGRPFDVTHGQLAFAFGAIHTTSGALFNTLFDLCANPDLMEPLRDEIYEVIGEDGLDTKSSLSKLVLMDSVLKESLRLHPVSIMVMNRGAVTSRTLSDGTILPKGASIAVPTLSMVDGNLYPSPERFDGYRFVRLRQQPGNEGRCQYVATSSEHLGFGYGKHACPGRFFAANELKIVLSHLLMKFDWKFVDGEKRPEDIQWSDMIAPNPAARIMYKARKVQKD
ncbi:hypothetical protein SLS56_012226 [Neofusicoccum ribis]|uniref:Cytochrome P450 monooxygenase n=1 Tax=Neofusicoccum ribis TaxID=45134 RepID=A0ABR3S9F6_9PEZI